VNIIFSNGHVIVKPFKNRSDNIAEARFVVCPQRLRRALR
jgi:hypothetical protein